MRILSPAKVNLNLEVRQRRKDGYHQIQTLMHRIDLADEMEIERQEEGIFLTLEGEETPPGEDNLVFRAARIFFQETKITGGARIRLKKVIPVAAGLGGGSSNAATVLMGLRDLFRTEVNDAQLMGWGEKIGADIPFFIFKKPAWAEGKGEKLKPAEVPAGLFFLLLIPPFRISTAWAYGAYDQLGVDKTRPFLVQNSYTDFSALLPILQNDLEKVSLGRFPEIGEMKEQLRIRGAQGTLMSGSGPVVFGLFSEPEGMNKAEKELRLPPGCKAIQAKGI